MKLYELNHEIAQIESQYMDFAESNDGDVTDFPLKAALDKLEGERNDKIINLALWFKNCGAEETAIAEERKKLQAREKTLKDRQDWLKTVIAHEVKEGEKLKDPRVNISWRASEAVEVTVEPELLPAEYQKVKIEADKTALKTALKSGISIIGATLLSRQNLQVK